MYSHYGTGARCKSSNEHQDLRELGYFVALNRKNFVEIHRLEKLLDEAHFRNGQYGRFVEIFKNRYPSQYADVVEEFKKVTEPNNGGLQNSSERS
jgi:hypothetical protein